MQKTILPYALPKIYEQACAYSVFNFIAQRRILHLAARAPEQQPNITRCCLTRHYHHFIKSVGPVGVSYLLSKNHPLADKPFKPPENYITPARDDCDQ